jgi:hypothetical protein
MVFGLEITSTADVPSFVEKSPKIKYTIWK